MHRILIAITVLAFARNVPAQNSRLDDFALNARPNISEEQESGSSDIEATSATSPEHSYVVRDDPSLLKTPSEVIESGEQPSDQSTPSTVPSTPTTASLHHSHHLRNVVIIVALGAVLLIVLAAAAK